MYEIYSYKYTSYGWLVKFLVNRGVVFYYHLLTLAPFSREKGVLFSPKTKRSLPKRGVQ